MVTYGKSASWAALAALLLASGCAAVDGPPPGRIGSNSTSPGIEGRWMDGSGAGITNFSGGRFETHAADSGQLLSEGVYNFRGGSLVEISGNSIIRQRPVSFNCSIAAANQLNCTSATGEQFIMTRVTGSV